MIFLRPFFYEHTVKSHGYSEVDVLAILFQRIDRNKELTWYEGVGENVGC
jgi:hypothetical protein